MGQRNLRQVEMSLLCVDNWEEVEFMNYQFSNQDARNRVSL